MWVGAQPHCWGETQWDEPSPLCTFALLFPCSELLSLLLNSQHLCVLLILLLPSAARGVVLINEQRPRDAQGASVTIQAPAGWRGSVAEL